VRLLIPKQLQNLGFGYILLLCFLGVLEGKEEDTATLYFSPASSCSWRVKFALDFKKIPYRIVETDVNKQGEEYRKINPMKKVPSLKIDGNILSQTVAIIEYLEETRPEPPRLLPANPYERSLVRQIMQIIASDIQPLQNGAVIEKFDDRELWARFWITRGFIGLEEILHMTSGTYAIGNMITAADVFLLPQIRNAHKYGVDFTPFPTLRKVEQNLECCDLFKKN
jgi:maleylacetoacetate isomerase